MSVRPDATEIGDARRRVEKLVCGMPGTDGSLAFDQPWELRAFAMAVAAYNQGHYEWSEFQLSLIDSIKRWEDDSSVGPWRYYEHWLNALEDVLAASGALTDSPALDDRTREILATPRDASHQHAHHGPVAVSPAGG